MTRETGQRDIDHRGLRSARGVILGTLGGCAIWLALGVVAALVLIVRAAI